MSNNKQVFAKFLDQEILAEMGRLLFTVLNAFAANGYQIKLFDNIDFERLEKSDRPYIRLVESLNDLTIVDSIPENTEGMYYLFDKRDKTSSKKSWKKQIHVKFDIYSSYLFSSFRNTQPLFFPYPIHPLLYGSDLASRLKQARRNERKVRIFFSGDTEGYKRNRIHHPTEKLTRTEVIGTVFDRMNARIDSVEDATTLDRLLQGEYLQRFVLVDNRKFRIDADAWLETLSKADFFLCPPGYVMPMCHNVIEAMAVGTIPIINYPEWLNPSLEDMVTCVTFDDRESLIEKIAYVLSLGQDKIEELRAGVVKYYQDNLDTSKFIGNLESIPNKNISLLMITDAHVATNEFKLGNNSILMTGEPMHPKNIWVEIRRAVRT